MVCGKSFWVWPELHGANCCNFSHICCLFRPHVCSLHQDNELPKQIAEEVYELECDHLVAILCHNNSCKFVKNLCDQMQGKEQPTTNHLKILTNWLHLSFVFLLRQTKLCLNPLFHTGLLYTTFILCRSTTLIYHCNTATHFIVLTDDFFSFFFFSFLFLKTTKIYISFITFLVLIIIDWLSDCRYLEKR